jgi:hypothetical protein
VFLAALDLAEKDVEFLRQAILAAVSDSTAIPGESDEYGSRYLVDFELGRGNKRARIRTVWIVRTNEDFPRLATC